MAGATVDTETRPGSRAVAKYVRSSAYKAREVLDLVRGKSYSEAREILTFSERRISDTIAKCLDSAVANAEHNDELDGEELFIAACYADEGPTLKRWRPRARGRATRIRKRTCHITVVVARYSDEELAAIDARMALKGTGRRSSAAEARRRRVAASRQRDEEHAEEHDHAEDDADIIDSVDDAEDEALAETEGTDDQAAEVEVTATDTEEAGSEDADDTDDDSPSDEAVAETEDTDEAAADTDDEKEA